MKKIYVEITNMCNLNCDFCIKNTRISKFMSKEDFLIILKKLKGITNYLYFHVLGEPLLHPLINEFIDLAKANNYYVNITTNGYLLKRVSDNKNIRQINISLHSFDLKAGKTLEEYLNDIFISTDKLKKHTYINYRIWVNNSFKDRIVAALEIKYQKSIKGHTKLDKNVYIDFDEEFIWPDVNNNYYNKIGKCKALSNHIGILVDGSVVPCCLDSKGVINLGNIFKEDINSIKDKELYKCMLQGFKDNKKIEELCRHCNFRY